LRVEAGEGVHAARIAHHCPPQRLLAELRPSARHPCLKLLADARHGEERVEVRRHYRFPP
jgi:hypothetical protein